MQVNRVQNNVNFGYNQQLNNELIAKIQKTKRNKEFFDTLLKLNTLTNETEGLIRKAEQENKKGLVSWLQDTFVELKVWLACNIDDHFPKLDYTIRECLSYLDEAKERQIDSPEHWLHDAVHEMATAQPDEDGNLLRMKLLGILPKDMSEDEFLSEKGFNITEKPPSEPAPAEAKKDATDMRTMPGKDYVKEYIPTESAKLGFASLGGMKELKALLNDRIVGMLKDPEQAKLDEIEYGKKMPKGILLYGPPGCGKTTIVEHLSTEAGVPLLKLEAGSLGSKYIHETSERIDAAFDYAEALAKEKPVLMFLDDAESMLRSREKDDSGSKSEEMGSFLNRIQRAGENNVVFITATNQYDLMDEAIRSRFEEQVFVDLPDKDARKSILKLYLEQRTKGKELAANDEALEEIANRTDKFPIRAIKMMTNRASLIAMNDSRRNIKAEDFYKIISESQNMKVKSNNYKTKNDRPSIGFGPAKTLV